jgi:pSer/pThr/pTyr-binding forkhead associated (FHA) protein
MPTLVLDLLKYAFLAVLYIFVARAVKAVYIELRGPRTPRGERGAPAPAPARAASRRTKKAARRVTVVEGDKHKGKSFDIGDELMIGRGDKCHIVLEDPYVSTVHARLFPKDASTMVEDMGSTNGTYLNRKRISAPMEVHKGDRVKIGKTVLEVRR